MRDATPLKLFETWKLALADELAATSTWHFNRAHACLRRIEQDIVEAPATGRPCKR
jgi:hypothetical protein